jgi:Fe-Mn family superoxide dismutase
MDKNAKAPEFAELKRRLGWEFNGMRLHEYHFENLGGKGPLKKSPLPEAMEKEFGSLSA